MGGHGSGLALGETARGTTEAAKRIEVSYLYRRGMLEPGARSSLRWTLRGRPTGDIRLRAETDALVLGYRYGDEPLSYRVELERTPCHFGGSRTWLRCPAAGCGRRVGILYGGRVFVCRTCADLAYPSTREGTMDLHARRADRIRARLGWTPGVFNGPGARPKGMHERTYWRLFAEYERHWRAFASEVVERFPTPDVGALLDDYAVRDDERP